jgi:hypothetical protein
MTNLRQGYSDEDSKRIGGKIDLPFFEFAVTLVRFNQVASMIMTANRWRWM